MQRFESGALPTIERSPMTATRRAPLQMLQHENGLADLAPECGFVSAKSLEDSVIEVGQTKKAARKLPATAVGTGVEDFDNLAIFAGEIGGRWFRCGTLVALD